MLRNLSIKVNLINTRNKLLEFLDDEIIDALSYHLRDQGVLIRHGETISKVEGQEDGVVTHLESGKQIKTDIFLWANGRMGNVEDLGLAPLASRRMLVGSSLSTKTSKRHYLTCTRLVT